MSRRQSRLSQLPPRDAYDRALAMVSLLLTRDDGAYQIGRWGEPAGTRRSVWLPRSLIYSADAEGAPLVARLASRSDEALRLYLLMQVVKQGLLIEPGRTKRESVRYIDRGSDAASWPALLAMSGLTARAADVRLQRALKTLEIQGAITLQAAGVRGRYRAALTDLDVEVGRRRVGICVPASFFTHGWLLCMTASEICVLLMLMHLGTLYRRGPNASVFVPRTRRLSGYGVSDEIYLAHRELAEFRLVDLVDREMNRRRGRTVPPNDRILLPYEFLTREFRGLYSDARHTIEWSFAPEGETTASPHLKLDDRPTANARYRVEDADEGNSTPNRYSASRAKNLSKAGLEDLAARVRRAARVRD